MRFRITLVVMMSAVGSGLSSPTFAGEEPTPHAIIDRALKAGGGAENIRLYKAVSFKAETKIEDTKETVKLSGIFAAPTLFRIKMEKTGITKEMLMVSGGDTFWIKEGTETVKEFHNGKDKATFENMVRIFYGLSLPDQLLVLKRKPYKLTVVGDQPVNGVQAVALRVNHELRPEVLLYFDKATSLPVKAQLKIKLTNAGSLFRKSSVESLEFFFDDYKEINGLKHFTKLKMRVGDMSVVFEVRELKLLKTYDSEMFKKPK